MILASDAAVDICFGKALYVFMIGLLCFFTCFSIKTIRDLPHPAAKAVVFLFMLLPTLAGFYVFHKVIGSFSDTTPAVAFWSGETFYISVFWAIAATMAFLAIAWIIGTAIIGALTAIVSLFR